jgi:hypothetical protein
VQFPPGNWIASASSYRGGGGGGQAEELGRLHEGQPGENAESEELGLDRILERELLKSLVEGKEIMIGQGNGRLGSFQVDPSSVATALDPAAPACVLDEDSPHRLSRFASTRRV